MKRLVLIISIIVAFFATAKSQYVSDALRYSQNFPILTARSMAMGNAFTSLGGDFSSAVINPAGLGLYRKSEFLFSPGIGYSGIKSDYLRQTNDEYRYQFTMGSIGYVGTYKSNKNKGLVGATYAIGYNRLNNFYNNTYIRGINTQSSFSDYFVEYANDNQLVPDELNSFYERLAFDAWVIDTAGTVDQYKSLVPVPVEQRKTIQTEGGIGEWSFSMGLNFSDAFYVGMGLGINQLRYEQTAMHSEYNDDNYWTFKSFDFTEDVNVNGTGINFKLGLLARITESIRIGATFNMPTYYNIKEDYYNTMYSEFVDTNYFIRPTDVEGNLLEAGIFKYKFNTPLKLSSGISFQMGKFGMISGDVEYINYGSMRMRVAPDFNSRSERDLIDATNDEIQSIYKSVVNLKLGGEIRLSNFSIRAGGGYYPSPYKNGQINEDASYTELTSGIGYRTKNFFFDLGFSGLLHKENYNLYSSANTDNIAKLTQNKYRVLATVGFRF
jgi:hypothetical protein